ncbi:Propeptide peptidase M4 and M36 [Caldithrix abyssi DSM 13497]|uniref:Propeptide peptidase M4 and M36 n=2 Tax=Caldithrix abyssi DSM 13497 TaxID=880073 RepID=H1XSQ2_CALAY|nr:carboxypeptidase regulatory-like domain-containing protein [Caldithrix abyssi]EHO40279.1 Propeptide peptidase M4 and M36 [Caldithrix abyssi DSM 13497]
MRLFKGVLICMIIFGFQSFSIAGSYQPQSKFIKNNVKEYSTLKTSSGRIDEKTGIYRYHYNLNVSGYSGTAEQIVRSYLKDNFKKYGIDPQTSTLRTLRVRETPGGFHVFFEQTINNIPVYDGRMVVTLNPQKAVTFVASHYRPTVQALNIEAQISMEEALSIARDYLQVTGKPLGEHKAHLVWFESKDRGTELCWRVSMPTEQPLGDWEVLVNAVDGRITNVKDLRMFNNGRGLVFDPDPLTTAGVEYGGDFVDNNDADSDSLNNQRIEVILRDITYENGLYKLKGPYAVLVDLESPADNFPELADSSAFRYTRYQQEFEHVMAYYHVDLSTRYLILELGYDEPAQREFQVDPHGLNGDDNSHYMSSSNYIAFGEGGVDDAEDADVLWHEHAHSFQTNLTGGMSYSGETMSLQEGSSDYWAASYSRMVNDYNWGYVFSWDGHNEFWAGRRCDLDWVYPDDYVSGHDGGQIWSSALMDIWADLGRYITDRLFIETHYIWGYSPGLQDAAQAYIQADRNLYNGEHLSVIVEHFAAHGLVNKQDYIADIQHTPLEDTEDYTNDYPVVATITPGPSPLDTTRLWVIWGVNTNAPADTLNMHATGNPDEYRADIPASGNNIDISYYIAVVDQNSQVTYDPANQPDSLYSFHVGPDTLNPTISHTPLDDQTLDNWPATVTATITDNFGVDTVICFYSINNDSLNKSFPMLSNGTDVYSGAFPENVQLYDSVFYRIHAVDISNNQNQSDDPVAGYHAFKIIQNKGKILIIDDETINKTGTGASYTNLSKTAYDKSANTIASYLSDMGYETLTVTVAAALDSDFTKYDLIISSSGANQSPVADANYRTKLENWVSDPAHKLLIEGGEVGYDALKSPGYSSFASNVLHVNNWWVNDGGSLNLNSSYQTHPLATTPNTLPSTINITYGAVGDQDTQSPLSPAYVVYGTNLLSSAMGILVYDPDSDSTSAQTVYYGFNFDALSDQSIARQLLENTVTYLLADRPRGVIDGFVDMTDKQDDSGVTVYLSGSATDSTVTNSTGYYAFTGLSDGTYTVKPYADGYTSSPDSVSNISVNQDTVSNVNFTLTPVVSDIFSKNGLPTTYAVAQNYPNPFNPTTTIRYQIPKSSDVKLVIYNTSGKKIRTLVNAVQSPGYYSITWAGRNNLGQKVASGIYIYYFKAGNFQSVKKMILLK